MKPMLGELQISASPDDYQQIADAIASSETLRQEIYELTVENQFTGILVLPRAQLTDRKAERFGGFLRQMEPVTLESARRDGKVVLRYKTPGPKIVLTTEYLKELKEARLFDMVYPDDILPNHTVFALAHLLYHIRNPFVPYYAAPGANEEKWLKIEASAFIYAWNTMLQVAERDNGAKPLSERQFGQLLLNTRHRFALIGAMEQKPDPLQFSPSGSVEFNETNIQAVAATLKNSKHLDNMDGY
jgi:hypothetical protein